ncbi:citrate lyase holo-[acyl-carrier protein] synthase [Halocella sp. SP3-1]|nr:citrate lyase holo-[acyl-carrier protein] synthase [Halocella sp. SP3-1]
MNMIREISLQELLRARELRAARQKELINKYQACLISFMVNTPGKFKVTVLSKKIHDEGSKVLRETFEKEYIFPIYQEVHKKATGIESFILVNMDEIKLKKILVEIEDNHLLGRLFDFDVINKEYQNISRQTIKKRGRRCLLCKDQAAVCVRSQKHSYEELLEKINTISKEYFNMMSE